MKPEYERARELANKVLDRPNADPDDDLAVLARQFLRAIEPIDLNGPHIWTCEKHPWLEWPHANCAGPGMPIGASLRHIIVLEAALREIRRGTGPYSRDHLQHAANCIQYAKDVAARALKGKFDGEYDPACPTCGGTGAVAAPFSGSDPSCPDCGGEGVRASIDSAHG